MIFLAFLKALGLIIIIILIIAVLLLLGLLFAPIHLSFDGNFHGKPEANLNVRWLFGLFSLKGTYKNDKLDYSLHFPFKFFKDKLKSRKKPKKPKKNKEKKTSQNNKEISQLEKAKSVAPENNNVRSNSSNKTDRKAQKTKEKKSRSRLSALKENITAILSVENKGDIINCFVKNIKQMLYKFNFKAFKINILFGFDDPALTGELLGVLYAGGLAFIDGVNIQTDFDKKVIDADAEIKGKGNLFNIAVPTVKFILNKNVRKVLF